MLRVFGNKGRPGSFLTRMNFNNVFSGLVFQKLLMNMINNEKNPLRVYVHIIICVLVALFFPHQTLFG